MTTVRKGLRAVAVVVVSLALVLTGAHLPAHAAKATKVTLASSHTEIRKGEMVWLRGKVTAGGKGVKGATVRLERRTGTGKWARVGQVKSKANGVFSLRQRPAKQYTYRARVIASGNLKASTSTGKKITYVSGDRSMANRKKALGNRVGASRGAAKTVTASGATVRYRNYSKMMLVEVTKPSSKRTWLVYGDIRRKYLAEGGPAGKLGAPLADPKCGLIETGCVQRFAGGAIYDNKNHKGTVVYGKTRAAEVLAVGLSQVGFKEKTKNRTKYNSWVGSTGQPWCSAFQSWLSYASGNGQLIPKHKRLRQLVADIRNNDALKTGKTPKVGALAFFDFVDNGVTEPTHIGIVYQVKKNSILFIEGNTSPPNGGSARGVYLKERARSVPIYYAYPEY